MSRISWYVAVVGVFMIAGFCAVAAVKAGDHPVIKPYPGSTLLPDYYRHKTYEKTQMYVMEGKSSVVKDIEGEYWELSYEIRNAAGDVDESVSASDIIGNYRSAAVTSGGEILYDEDDVLTFRLPVEQGDVYWVYIKARDGRYTLWILKEKGLETKLQFSAESMKKELDASGRVAVYGINFDVDKAFLKPGAELIIIEMVKLLLANPGLKLEIQGHTDNTGSDARNLELSKERAAAVKSFLVLYGIAPQRLQTNGYGSTKPHDANDTEEGRAKNRRVELVRLD